MFCVIQKVLNKKACQHGAFKELLLDETLVNIDGTIRTRYGFKYSMERFDRPILDAYKISIHHSYRENDEVQKKQWSVCTMSFYDLIDSKPNHCINSQQLKLKLQEMGISERQLWELVYQKLDPIISAVKAEFEATEEHEAVKLQKKQLKAWHLRKLKFEKAYGVDAYDLL